MYVEPKFLACGDSALSVEFGDTIDIEVNARVLTLDRSVSRQPIAGITETVPTYRSLLIHYDPLQTTFAELQRDLLPRLKTEDLSGIATNRAWSVPVVYGGEFGIDLEMIAIEKQITTAELIERHSTRDYRVCMIGFMPGFAYLGGLDERLATPRRKQPRPAAPRGTISIGGEQTALQSVPGPSGWHWIGRTPLDVYAPDRNPMCLLEPGDIIRFYPIERREWAAETRRCEAMIRETLQ
ncbi:MAG: 5-oxoprolinase subunit PxpB [Alphaproteobacteria bacterium]|nr:5-oxoprolinase subunit PxpB [Alphaproteobacteria bacterium]